MHDVALITCKALPEPDADEPLLLAALARAGLGATMHPWDAEGAALPDARLFVVRSTWNYHHALPSFLAWLDAAAKRAPLLNAPEILRWNTDKRYLRELESEGLAIVPTAWIEQGSTVELGSLMRERGWSDVVVKPRVSAGSYRTSRHTEGSLVGGELAGAAADRALMVQPYVKAVDGRGERSYVFIDEQPTHAVRKSPRLSGQEESVAPVPLDAKDVAFAARAVALASRRGPGKLLYARVDVARDDHDEPMLMELELVEPSLFFVHAEASLARFVEAVQSRLQARLEAAN